MALNHGVLPRHERAKEVAKALNGKLMYKTDMMKTFSISFGTATLVYEIQGHKPITKSQAQAVGRNRKNSSAKDNQEHRDIFTRVNDMNSHQLRAKKAEEKKKLIIDHIQKHGPMKQRQITAKFSCGRALARQAMEEAGFKNMKSRDWIPGGRVVPEDKGRLKEIANYLKRHPNTGVGALTNKFKCGRTIVDKAKEMIGMKPKVLGQNKSDVVAKEDRPMHRPNGENWLARAWV